MILEKQADIVKHRTFQYHQVIYTEKSDSHKEEAQSAITVG
jgi:hypothetical protein